MRHNTKRCARLSATLAVGLAIVTAASPAAEPPTLGKDVWLRVTTPNFTLFGEVPEARLRVVAVRLETYRGALERVKRNTA